MVRLPPAQVNVFLPLPGAVEIEIRCPQTYPLAPPSLRHSNWRSGLVGCDHGPPRDILDLSGLALTFLKHPFRCFSDTCSLTYGKDQPRTLVLKLDGTTLY